METTLGFIGLGLMGTPMARRFLQSGYPVAVFNRTKEKASQLIAEGARIWRFEKVEQATTTKLLCNFFIATMISGLCQALVMAKKIRRPTKRSPRDYWRIRTQRPDVPDKGASIIERNFKPRLVLEHMLKDVNLLTDAAQNLGVAMPSGEIAQAFFSEAMVLGLAREDYSSVVRVLERIAQVEVN